MHNHRDEQGEERRWRRGLKKPGASKTTVRVVDDRTRPTEVGHGSAGKNRAVSLVDREFSVGFSAAPRNTASTTILTWRREEGGSVTRAN